MLGVCGGFGDFFESLDHRCFKEQLRSFFVGGISDDYYRVLKSATRYSAIDMHDLPE